MELKNLSKITGATVGVVFAAKLINEDDCRKGVVDSFVKGCSVGGSTENLVKIKRATGCYNYGDAVQAIMSSSMWSDDKKKAISTMSKDATHGEYEAVISIVKSTMWSDDKVKSIRDIFK